ncbi:NAD(P)-dependent oxidoreductase [Nocardia tengchongensis]
MKVTVFGATGAIGSLTVDQLLAAGHTVTVYARNPAKIPGHWGERVHVVIGEMSDTGAIGAAVTGADAVISALGPSMDRRATGLPLIEGTVNILEAMKREGVRRFIGHATPSVLDPRETPTLATRAIGLIARTALPRAYAEITGMSEAIKDSGLEWTIVRFTAPKDGPAKNLVRSGFFGTDQLGFAITRADIAAFTADQVSDTRYLYRAPAISN